MTTKLVTSAEEIKQILEIQKENHLDNVSKEMRQTQGFVTVKHDLALIQKMNATASQIIAVDNSHVAGYALVMLKELAVDVPALIPMFETLKGVTYKGKFLSEHNFYVMGQICIKEAYKGKGLFRALYQKHKDEYSGIFDLCVTEVSTSNIRSMAAHLKVGFKQVYTYTDALDEWSVVIWDWN